MRQKMMRYALLALLVAACVNGDVIKARVNLGQYGWLDLTSLSDGGAHISANLTNLPAGLHGFHVHQYGDIYSDGCASTGGHFNPAKMDHGAPTDKVRHVGDLGNISADADGTARFEMSDSMISLSGPNSIIGRAFVIHQGVDDLGRGIFHVKRPLDFS